MGLNLSNRQIAQELELDKDDVQAMTTQLRQGIVDGQPTVQLVGEVECDEVYVTARHKGNPDAVRKKGAKDDAIVSKGYPAGSKPRGRGTLEKEKPPIYPAGSKLWHDSTRWRSGDSNA